MNDLNRRRFIQALAASGVGSTFLGAINFVSCQKAPAEFVAPALGGLSHFIIVNDVAHLALQSNMVDGVVKTLITADFNLPIPANLSRMGTLVPFGESQLIPVLKTEAAALKSLAQKEYTPEELEELQKNAKRNPLELKDKSERKVALILGWFMAAGIRSVLAPQAGNSENGGVSEKAIYWDMYLFRELSGPDKIANATTGEIESLFKGFNPRMIGRTHTLTPDYDDGENWTVRISDWRDRTMELMARYAEAYSRPDQGKVAEYVNDTNFYNGSDDLVKLISAARDRKGLSPELVKKAFENAGNQSLYSRAVAVGTQELTRAAEIMAA